MSSYICIQMSHHLIDPQSDVPIEDNEFVGFFFEWHVVKKKKKLT